MNNKKINELKIMKVIKSIILFIILACIIVSPIVEASTFNATWAAKKGDKFTWEIKTYELAEDDEFVLRSYGLVPIKEGDMITVTVKDFVENIQNIKESAEFGLEYADYGNQSVNPFIIAEYRVNNNKLTNKQIDILLDYLHDFIVPISISVDNQTSEYFDGLAEFYNGNPSMFENSTAVNTEETLEVYINRKTTEDVLGYEVYYQFEKKTGLLLRQTDEWFRLVDGEEETIVSMNVEWKETSFLSISTGFLFFSFLITGLIYICMRKK